MAERTINVGFHSNFGIFRQSGDSLQGFSIALIIHSLDPLRLAIINGFPFNPTYVLKLQSRDGTGAAVLYS